MKRLLGAFVIVASSIGAAITLAQTRSGDAPRSASRVQLDALDRSADACTDFYQFACGGWIAHHPIPADQSSWGRFSELDERNQETLRGEAGLTTEDTGQRTEASVILLKNRVLRQVP